MNKISQRLLS